MSSQPRALVIAMRSYTGSRVALFGAAVRLLTGSKAIELGGGGSSYRCYEEDGQQFLAAAVLYRSSLSVNELLEQMRTVEQLLSERGHPGQPPTLALDLLWVEGVEVSTPELTLPSPLLEERKWASMVFIHAGEDALVAAAERGTESTAVAKRIARAFKRFKETRGGNPLWVIPIGGTRSPSFHRGPVQASYENAAVDEADAVATAGNLALFAREERRHRQGKVGASRSENVVANAVQHSLSQAPLKTVELLSVPQESGQGVEQRALAWTKAMRDHEARTGLRAYMTVVFSMDKSGIRGAVLGEKGAGLTEQHPLLPVESVKLTPIPRTPSPTLEVSLTIKE